MTIKYRILKPEPLAPNELHTLATYNAERARGIMHTPEYARKMHDLQSRFNVYGSRTTGTPILHKLSHWIRDLL
jgi:hypothetical protein